MNDSKYYTGVYCQHIKNKQLNWIKEYTLQVTTNIDCLSCEILSAGFNHYINKPNIDNIIKELEKLSIKINYVEYLDSNKLYKISKTGKQYQVEY